MNGSIEKRDDSAPAPAREKKSPLALLPEEWREPVGFFYAAWSDVLKGSTGIVARLRYRIKTDALTLDELRPVLTRLLNPEESARIQFPGQLLARVSELIAEVVAKRRSREREEARRRQAEADKANAAPAEEWRRKLAGIGRPDGAP